MGKDYAGGLIVIGYWILVIGMIFTAESRSYKQLRNRGALPSCPRQAGIQQRLMRKRRCIDKLFLDSRLRGNDKLGLKDLPHPSNN